MKHIDPLSVSVSRVFGAAVILGYLVGAGCTSIPDPRFPAVQSVEITQAQSHIENGGTPGTGQYTITLKQPAQDGQGITLAIFEDDSLFDERIVEDRVTLKAGAVEHTGTFELACDEDGSLIGTGYHDESGRYEVYASVVDILRKIEEEPMANRVLCVPPSSSP